MDGFGVGAVFHFFGEADVEDEEEKETNVNRNEAGKTPGVKKWAEEDERVKDEEAEEAAGGGEFVFGKVGEFVIGDGFDLVGREFCEEAGGEEEFMAERDGVGEREW